METKVQDLTGRALDWAVSVAHGDDGLVPVEYSSDWQFGGPIIEQESMFLTPFNAQGVWVAHTRARLFDDYSGEMQGLTPLTAAMRCYVLAKLGNYVDVPEEFQ